MQKTRALLIDDEAMSRRSLRAMLSLHPEIQIVGEADSLQPARELLSRDNYDVIFLDIKLGRDTAFDLVPDVPADKPIIFVTGYPQHAPRAFEVNAVDYLVKPVRPERLNESLLRLQKRKRLSPPPTVSVPPALGTSRIGLSADDTVVLELNSRARLVRVAEIVLITAQGNYSTVYLVGGGQVFVRRSLKSWADSLPSTDFMRAHRNALVNLTHITSYQHESPRRISLRMVDLTRL
jgi:two-component system LytT family response regulator